LNEADEGYRDVPADDERENCDEDTRDDIRGAPYPTVEVPEQKAGKQAARKFHPGELVRRYPHAQYGVALYPEAVADDKIGNDAVRQEKREEQSEQDKQLSGMELYCIVGWIMHLRIILNINLKLVVFKWLKMTISL
jgi:hypothetical protein